MGQYISANTTLGFMKKLFQTFKSMISRCVGMYVDAHVTTVGTAYSLPIQLRASFKGELAVSSRSSLPPSFAEAPLLLLFSKPTLLAPLRA